MLWKKIPICICKRDVAFNQDVKALKVKSNVNSIYLLYWFLAHQGFLLSKVVGTGIGAGKLDSKELKSLSILFPPIPEQKAIADLLSTWDEAIRKMEQLIQAKEKKFQQLLRDLIYIPVTKGHWKEVQAKSLFQERRESKRNHLPLLSITGNEWGYTKRRY